MHAAGKRPLKRPGEHIVATMEPGGHAVPGEHSPEHVLIVAPGVDPKYPALQFVHADAPATPLQVPAGHLSISPVVVQYDPG